jgi:hypothetical protein
MDGEPTHWVTGKNGKERDTTLRDARKMNLCPSVTTILGILDKPGLNRWKIDQAYLACLTLPRVEGETLEEFKKRAIADAAEQVTEACDTGSEIHAAIEASFKGEPFEIKWGETVCAVMSAVQELTGLKDGWIAEKSFGSPEGYGGMVDLHHPDGWVIDYKTRDFGADQIDKQKGYDEQCMQLSAYAHGLGMPDAKKANIFVSRTEPGVVALHEWDVDYYERFELILKYWQLVKGYKPCG